MGRGPIPYLGYVEKHLQIPGIRKLDEDVLMLVLEGIPYGDRVLIQIRTLHIDRVIDLVSEDEIDALIRKWKRGRISTLLANRLAILQAGHITTGNSTGFTLDKVSATVKTTRAAEIPLFQTVLIQVLFKVEGHKERVYSLPMSLQSFSQNL